MFKHLSGERSYVICPDPQKVVFINKPILASTLAAGSVQDTFAGEAGERERGEEEITGGYFYRSGYFYHSG